MVATRVGVVPEVLEDGATALLVPAGEPVPLAAAIERLLRDAALRARVWAPRAPRWSASATRAPGSPSASSALYLSLAADSARPAR